MYYFIERNNKIKVFSRYIYMEVINTTTTTDPINMYNYLNGFILKPVVLIILIAIIVIYYFMFSSTMSIGNGSSSSKILIAIIAFILVFLVLANAFQYFFSINVSTYIKGLFTPQTVVDIVVDQSSYQPAPVPEIKIKKQVFNIPGNYYTYSDAKALCSAYGAKLANYDQIETAYNNGAEWCNYGWSANQLALFPTQKKSYDKLQSIPGHENDCGRPGINGGYIANPNVRFGVNCYGYKPKITSEEEELMKTTPPYPETPQDIAFQKKVDIMKNNLDKILVSPFNYNSWSAQLL